MTHHLFFALALSAVVAPVCEAGIATGYYYITARKSKAGEIQYLAVKDGKLVIGPAASRRDARGKAPDRWHLMGTQIKASVGGGYLAFDASGKSKRIFLSPRPVKGAEWRVRRVYNKLSNHLGESVGYEWGVVQAASGLPKGWSLDIEEVEQKRGDSSADPIRRLIFGKKPSWNVEAGGIYDHK